MQKTNLWPILATLVVLSLIGSTACSQAVPEAGAPEEEEEQEPEEEEQEPEEEEEEEIIYWDSTSDTGGGHTSSGIFDRYFRDMVRDKSNGRLRIRLHWVEELCSREDNRIAIQSGLVDMGSFSYGYLPTSMHSVQDQPFMGPSRTDQIILTWQKLEENNAALKAEWEKYNVKYIAHVGADVYKGMGLIPIRTIEDLDGLRIRVWGKGLVDLMELCGAVPMVVGMPEMYGVLDTGLVDDVVHVLTYLESTKCYEISDYFMEDLNLGIMTGFRVYNKDSYNSLPEDLQAVLDEVAATIPQVSHFIEQNPAVVAERHQVFQDAGLEFVKFEDRDKLEAKAYEVWEAWANRCDLGYEAGMDLIDDYMEAKAEVLEEHPDGLPAWTQPFPWVDPNYSMFPD